MTIVLNQRGFDHARNLIAAGRYVIDDRDAWSEHQPSTQQENEFIQEHGIDEYARWHLGIDNEAAKDNKTSYRFPYGDFDKLHRCGLLAAESRAGQRRYFDVELVVAHLHGMLEALRLTA